MDETVVVAPAAEARPRGFKAWWGLAKQAAAAWVADYAPSMGAALSYYSVFSMAPLLLIVISVAGLVFGEDAVRGELFNEISGLVGADAARAIEGVLASVAPTAGSITSTVVGVIVVLIGATTVFAELQNALDRIWRAPARERSGGVWTLLRTRLLSFGMILGIAFLLMVSLVASAALAALGKWWAGAFEGWQVLARLVDLALGFAMTTAVFALIYKFMPRVHVQWRDVWVGAVVTAALFTVGRWLIGLYIGKSGVASGWGAAGSVIVVFVWVYYSAQIFLIGAEFTWIYANTYGSRRGLAGADGTQVKTAAEIPDATQGSVPDPSAAAGAAAAAGTAVSVSGAADARGRVEDRSFAIPSRRPASGLRKAGMGLLLAATAALVWRLANRAPRWYV
jgi:membrane protein